MTFGVFTSCEVFGVTFVFKSCEVFDVTFGVLTSFDGFVKWSIRKSAGSSCSDEISAAVREAKRQKGKNNKQINW